MTNLSTISQQKKKGKEKIFPILIAIQLIIAVLTVTITVIVGLKIRPLIEEKLQLEKEIDEKKTAIARIEEEIINERQQLRASREAVAFVTYGINFYHQGRYENAIAAYNQALSLDSLNAYILNLKGYSLFKAKRFDEAVDVLSRAVNVQPDYAWGYFDLARASCANGNFDLATNAIKKAIELRPDLATAMRNDGEFTRFCKPILSLLKE